MTNVAKKIPGTVENWDSGKLGASEAHCKPVSQEQSDALDKVVQTTRTGDKQMGETAGQRILFGVVIGCLLLTAITIAIY